MVGLVDTEGVGPYPIGGFLQPTTVQKLPEVSMHHALLSVDVDAVSRDWVAPHIRQGDICRAVAGSIVKMLKRAANTAIFEVQVNFDESDPAFRTQWLMLELRHMRERPLDQRQQTFERVR